MRLSGRSRGYTIAALLVAVLMAIVPHGEARGQNDGRMHHYMFSQQDFNPAFAGSQGLVNIYTYFRQQWVGMGKGAPQLLFLNFDIPFKFRTPEMMTPGVKVQYSHGIGAHLFRDAVGFSSQNGVELSYTGRLHFRRLGSLSFGVGFRAVNDRFNAQWNAVDNADLDPAIPRGKQSTVSFDLSFGIYYSTSKMYFGLSGQNLLGAEVRRKISPTKKKGSRLGYAREIYMVGGYDVTLPDRWSLQPSVFLRSDFVQHEFAATLTATYNKLVWFGVNYYVAESVGALIGVNLFNGLRIGYTYDYPTSAIRHHSSGSHEVLLGYSFGLARERKPHRYYSIRHL